MSASSVSFQSDEEIAGIRSGLVRLFAAWGARHPEELAQETLARALRQQAESDSDPGKMEMPYCIGIARNVMKEERRKELRYSPNGAELAKLLKAPDERRRRDAKLTVEKLLEGLTAGERVFLLEYADKGSADTAKESGMTSGAARLRNHRLVVKLRGLAGIDNKK